jgi:poly(3-hydroxybutyrate) depolymerase
MPRSPRLDPGVARRRRLAALLVVIVIGIAGLELLVGPASERLRHGADLERIEVNSDAVGQTLPVNVVVPAGGGEGRPLLIFLHGRGSNGEDSNLNESMYQALADQGKRAPIVAFPDGGDHSYWHDRADGDWGRYLIDEVIPRVADQFGADPKRVAIGGISMGGFGALDVARLNPGGFCAVGAHSPALWQTGGETAPGAFDDEADFEDHDVIEAAESAPTPYLGQPVWVDAGDADPFRPGIGVFTSALRANDAPLTFHIWPGEHEGSYWEGHWDDYMGFYARALADCR